MANYQGSNGQVKIKSGASSQTAIADVRSWSLTLTREVIENTAMGDGDRKYLKGLQSYSGSMEIVYNDSEDAVVNTALNPDTDAAVQVELYADTNNSSTSKFVGDVIVTSFSVTNSYDGLMTASVEFTGTGAPTVTNWKF